MNRTYTYDAENRLIAVDGGAVSYQYDASGRRVRKTVGGSTTEYVLDLEGRVVQEYGPSLSLVRTELFAGGQHLGTYRDGVTYFSHTDWLGTERARTNMAGAVVETFTSLPFGDALSSPGSVSPLHFTGKERDAESGLDYFGARYYGSTMGRFLSPDPIGIIKQKLTDPQQWNIYSYTRNNPLRFLDPTGMYVANCGNGVKNCDKQIQNFDKALQNALKSRNADIRKAAEAYGKLGDKNGVNVSLVKVVDAKHPDVLGSVTAQPETGGLVYNESTGKVQQATQVNIKAGMDSSQLEETAVHEGVHVEDRANFVSSISSEFTNWNLALNITGRQSEINAYGVENLWRGLANMPLLNINDILAHSPYRDNPNIDKPLFPDLGGPE